MPTIEIDGREVQVEAGQTLIQAAEKLGINVPRYCYHPGLKLAGSCRMCMVEVEKMPKLAIACYTQAQDGMKVSTTSQRVLDGRRNMLEFLLHNHPLDCPVCDQSGECDLQNFYMEHGRYDSRFIENKLKKRKAFPIGPHVMLDQERCIVCTRCTRFCAEVPQTHELGVFNRGDRTVIDLNPGKTLDNPYSGNVIDICPVGALTEREFRFQCRVWYLSSQASVCPGCSRGCNISIHYNAQRRYKSGGRRIQRLKPRFNPDVNRWWMCDEGRFGYSNVDDQRLQYPSSAQAGAEWADVLARAARLLREALSQEGPDSIGVIVSPQMSNEELYLAKRLFQEGLGIERIGFRNPWEAEGFSDDDLIRADKNPNSRGAEDLGLTSDVAAILQDASEGRIKLLYLFHHLMADEEPLSRLDKGSALIYQGSNRNPAADRAELVFPAAVYAEKDGSFTNFEGRVQVFRKAFAPLGDARPDVEILLELGRLLEVDLSYQSAEDLFRERFGRVWDEWSEGGEIPSEAAEQAAADAASSGLSAGT